MTLDDLVKKLRDTHGSTGGFAVLRSRLEKIRVFVGKRNEALAKNRIEEHLFLTNYIDEEYEFVSGFIWGLCSLGYLSDEECEVISDELMEVAS